MGLFWDEIVSVCLESDDLAKIRCNCANLFEIPERISTIAEACAKTRAKDIHVTVCGYPYSERVLFSIDDI